jgi:hypothetical protein
VKKALLLLALVLGLAALAAPAGAQSTKFVYFRMPSKNIACAYTTGFGPPFLRCDIYSGLRPKPSRRCTEGAWDAVSMTRTGKARPQCISDSVYNNKAPVLNYGQTWKYGGFKCKSKTTGLTCTSITSGHGFFLSRQSWSVH